MIGKIEQLLLLCALNERDTERVSRFLHEHGAEIPWDTALEVIEQHRMVPLAVQQLSRVGWPEVPEDLCQALQKKAQAQGARSLFLERKLEGLIHAARVDGLELIPFKGPALSRRIFGDAGLRACDDLDVLVKRSHLARARTFLLGQGYRLHASLSEREVAAREKMGYGFTFVHEKEGLHVDLDSVISPRWYRFGLDADELLQQAGGWKEEGLDPAWELLALSLHGAKHGWSRINWLADLHGMLALTHPDSLARVARYAGARGMGHVLCSGFFLLNQYVETPVPDALKDLLICDKKVAAMISAVEDRWGGDRAAEHRFRRGSLERSRDRVEYWFLPAFLPGSRDWKTFQLPKSLFFLYFVLRPIRILVQRVTRRR